MSARLQLRTQLAEDIRTSLAQLTTTKTPSAGFEALRKIQYLTELRDSKQMRSAMPLLHWWLESAIEVRGWVMMSSEHIQFARYATYAGAIRVSCLSTNRHALNSSLLKPLLSPCAHRSTWTSVDCGTEDDDGGFSWL